MCENFGLNARNFAVGKFDINKVVKRHLEIYNNKLSDEKILMSYSKITTKFIKTIKILIRLEASTIFKYLINKSIR